MFERGKKDEGFDAGAEPRPTETRQSAQPARPRASGGDGGSAVIGRSIEIIGDVRGNEDLRIEGDVSGTVELRNSNLTIGKEGKIRADVFAKSIVVDGTTEGDLYASDRIVVHVSADVRGNITAPKIGIEEGAKFKGSIEMDQEAVEKALGKMNKQSAAKPAPDRQNGKSGEAKIGVKPVTESAATATPQPGRS